MRDSGAAMVEDDAAALAVLEARLGELEAKVWGAHCAPTAPLPEGTPPAAEALTTANTMLLAATSGREKASAVLHQRLHEVDGYLALALRPSSVTKLWETEAAGRWELVRREEPAIRLTAERLRRLTELQPVLDPRPLRSVTELQPRVHDLAAAAHDGHARAAALEREVRDLRQVQLAALDAAKQGLALLELQVSRLEAAKEPKKPLD